jgi:hypothetical protein
MARNNAASPHKTHAIRNLNSKTRFAIDKHFLANSHTAQYSLLEFNLDFLLVIPSFPGFDVLLPASGVTHASSWKFTFNLSSPNRSFKSKHGLLGFRPDRAVLYIGRSDASEDIWLCNVPDDFLDFNSQVKVQPAETTFTEPTQMSRKHLRMILSFFLCAFAKEAIASVSCPPNHLYSDAISDDSFSWLFSTNFESVSCSHILFFLLFRPNIQSFSL